MRLETPALIAIALHANMAVAQNEGDIATAIVSDINNNLAEYLSYVTVSSPPSGLLDIYRQAQTYTNNDYTTLITNVDQAALSQYLTGLPWYSSRLAGEIAAVTGDASDASVTESASSDNSDVTSSAAATSDASGASVTESASSDNSGVTSSTASESSEASSSSGASGSQSASSSVFNGGSGSNTTTSSNGAAQLMNNHDGLTVFTSSALFIFVGGLLLL